MCAIENLRQNALFLAAIGQQAPDPFRGIAYLSEALALKHCADAVSRWQAIQEAPSKENDNGIR
jgi:hypothetical protein